MRVPGTLVLEPTTELATWRWRWRVSGSNYSQRAQNLRIWNPTAIPLDRQLAIAPNLFIFNDGQSRYLYVIVKYRV